MKTPRDDADPNNDGMERIRMAAAGPTVKIESGLPLRKWLYSWLLDPTIPGNLQKGFDRWIGILIVVNLFAMLFEHVPAVYEPNKHWFHWFDVFSVIVFTFEYGLRFYLAPEDQEFQGRKNPRIGYIKSPFAIIDFLAVAPFYLQALVPVDLRVLRALRLLRILKLFRVLIPAFKEFVLANAGRSFRQKMHALVFPSSRGGALHNIFDLFIAFWVVISVIAVVLESVQSISYILHLEFIILDMIAVMIFTIEYCMRIYCCVEEPGFQRALAGRVKQAKTFSSVIDLLAIAPFFLEALLHHLLDLRFLRVFRLLRLLKLTRYTKATATLTKVIVREWPVMGASAFIMLLMVVLTASLGYLFEHDAQPEKFENIPQSIYWAVITLASVGYGDISPVTPAGRIMTIILALMGIGMFALPAAVLSSAFTDQLQKEREALKGDLFEILEDGVISDEEAAIIAVKAKQLHLDDAEVALLIKQAKAAREVREDLSKLPLHKISQTPEHAIEHYKSLISEIRQLAILTDREQFESVAQRLDRLTQSELALWRQIHGG
ncbi:MAG: ion transporter [Proteobacteria bacterium]|nr:ion transporter [Pseudomonadota bacterium]